MAPAPPPTTGTMEKRPKSFEALTPELSQWILDFTRHKNFTRTTPVQGMAIPLLTGNKDLVVEAVTGSGKTLAFLIPIVERLLQLEEPNKKSYVRSIVVAPTKELAVQIFEVLRGMLEWHGASAARLKLLKGGGDDEGSDSEVEAEPLPPGPWIMPQLLIGGRTKLSEDLATFSRTSPNVLVGTPRRLSEVLQSSKVVLKRHWFDLLVLDEADRLLDPNFQPDLQKILELVPKERRTGLFSASVSEAVDELVRVGMRYPFKISAKVRNRQTGELDKRTPESLKLCYVVAKPTEKLPKLKNILERGGVEKSIVYVSTRAGVDYWSHILPTLLGVSVFPLHGDHKTAIRAKNLQRFRDCTTPAMLLTTDVLARGIDIPDIDLVVQLDPPAQPKDFIHRCGRSGRAGKRGMAITFLNEGAEEEYPSYLAVQGTKIEAYPEALAVDETGVATCIENIRTILQSKRELHDRSQKAFVSWVQSRSKTLPQDIFDLKKLDWAGLARSWGLLRWPRMPELKRHFPQAREDRTISLALPEDFDLNTLAYSDKVREQKRQELLESFARGEKYMGKRAGGNALEQRRRGEKAWSSQKGAKALREARRERKEVRRTADRRGKMSEGERVEARELDELIARVRERGEREVDEGTFEGFGD